MKELIRKIKSCKDKSLLPGLNEALILLEMENERNRAQKDWLDNLEKRMGYESKSKVYKPTSSGLLPSGYSDPIERVQILTPPPDSPLPSQEAYKPKPKPNRPVYKLKRPYHHSF